jgi:hypothetical protein
MKRGGKHVRKSTNVAIKGGKTTQKIIQRLAKA